MKNQTEQPKLQVHEWLSLAIILGFLGSLTLLSLRLNQPSFEVDHAQPHYIHNPYVEIEVEGAVAHPGKIRVKKGTTLREALELAQVAPEADTKKLNLDSKIQRKKRIVIPYQKLITVYLEGAIEKPTAIRMPKGSHLCDLIHTVKFKEEADLKKITRSRLLKDGETIVIPAQKPTEKRS